jgi:hypothetical protein
MLKAPTIRKLSWQAILERILGFCLGVNYRKSVAPQGLYFRFRFNHLGLG